MTEDEIKHSLLRVCKVAGWDSDFNVVGFHALCDKLKELAVAQERERLAKKVEAMPFGDTGASFAAWLRYMA